MKNALGISTSDEDGVLLRLIAASSRRIASWLRRDQALQLTSRTEYLNPLSGQTGFYLKAYPITSITSVYVDVTGKYEGDEVLVPSDDYTISSDSRQLIFTKGYTDYSGMDRFEAFPTIPKAIRVIYTGGIAASATVSVWGKTTEASTVMQAGYYIQGLASGFVAKIKTRAATSITFEILYGVPEPGETIAEFNALEQSAGGVSKLKGATGATAALTTVTTPSLAEVAPDLVTACEMHIRYFRTNRDSFENINVLQDSVTRTSRSDLQKDYFSLPEIRDMLWTHRNRLVQ